jgi:hypothetical protein
MMSDLEALGPETVEILRELIALLDPLRPIHIDIAMDGADDAIIWIGRRGSTGELECLYGGRLDQKPSVDENGVPNRPTANHGPGARPCSQIMPVLGRAVTPVQRAHRSEM